uniref:Uncharacterized protein n=1 Tax=Nelumbo nucifera TaxID=4432 RepID=A0A822ZHK3_NELNU|nr:TPA_asm: hypothetical protein HUJ06_002852 [Nelumbo nucifera]
MNFKVQTIDVSINGLSHQPNELRESWR